jgi:acetoin utilization deacetylase AcuC-like enzyme
MKLLVVYHPEFYYQGYPPLKDRVEPVFMHLREQGYLDRPGVGVLEPQPAPSNLVERVHTSRHISNVGSSGYLDVAMLSTGGVVEASRKVISGEADNAFCFVGAAGHHASREGFWGFCFINDVAVAAMHLLDANLAERLAVIDIDPHYGDGTRDILGPEPRVLHVNFHSNGGLRSEAGPANLDIPLPYDAGDDLFMKHAGAAVDRAREFKPNLLYVVFGYDSHMRDYGAFRFTADAYRRFTLAVRKHFATGVCYVLSGGAEVDVGRETVGALVDILSS